MTIQELTERRNKLMFDARALATKPAVSPEDRSAIDQMLADAEAVRHDIDNLRTLDAFDAENRSQGNPHAAQPAANESPEERAEKQSKAFRSYLLSNGTERRDLTVSGNGILIPTGVDQPKVAKKAAGSLLDVVRRIKTSTGEPMRAPFVDDTANGMVLASVAISTTDPSVGGPILTVDDYRLNPVLLDRSLIQDSAFDVVGLVREAFTLRYQRGAGALIANGNTSNIDGIVGEGATVTNATTAVIAYSDLLKAFTSLDPAYLPNAAWAFNQATLGVVLGMCDKQDRPLFLPFNDGATSGFVGMLLGCPVKLSPGHPSLGVDKAYASFGDFASAYTWRDVGDVVVSVLNERYAELNRVGVVGFVRVAGKTTISEETPSMVSLIGK